MGNWLGWFGSTLTMFPLLSGHLMDSQQSPFKPVAWTLKQLAFWMSLYVGHLKVSHITHYLVSVNRNGNLDENEYHLQASIKKGFSLHIFNEVSISYIIYYLTIICYFEENCWHTKDKLRDQRSAYLDLHSKYPDRPSLHSQENLQSWSQVSPWL